MNIGLNDYNAISKNGNPYKRTNISKKIGLAVGLASNAKYLYKNKNYISTIGVQYARMMNKGKLTAKMASGYIALTKVVPTLLIALGAGTIADGIINKIKSSSADKKSD